MNYRHIHEIDVTYKPTVSPRDVESQSSYTDKTSDSVIEGVVDRKRSLLTEDVAQPVLAKKVMMATRLEITQLHPTSFHQSP